MNSNFKIETTRVMTTNWIQAFRAFLDRRALVMFCLGFSAGIPILLIFSSLSLWLGEAGVSKSAVTFFSWAALGYSFKFVWAPLVDELPIPFLTQKLGRRRSWLLVAQCLIMLAIIIMACSDPASGQLVQMAIGAVLLGFSAATQDIVIDAYRIELADTNMQTVLASTYNAGYRLGMIIAGAGALFLAASLGTAKGNYIYSAWQNTYFAMAAVMLIGVITTLVIREPQTKRTPGHYQRKDYFRLVCVFFATVLSFIGSYLIIALPQVDGNFFSFCLEAIRFLVSGGVASFVGYMLVKVGFVSKQMAVETWVLPIQDFFKRYGVKLALLLLLLIGFYRISDIIAGVISNVFYQDLNFTKEEIAKAVKVYGVVFSLLGGFLGGLLAQRFNIMKLMFIGAILASSTNLIFIGLIKSGELLCPITLEIGQQKITVQPDDAGYFTIPKTNEQINITTEIGHKPSHITLQALSPVRVFPIYAQEHTVINGQVDLQKIHELHVEQNNQIIPIKIDENGFFTGTVSAKFPAILVGDGFKQDLQYMYQDPSIQIEAYQGKVIKSYSSGWLYFAIVVDNLASGLAGAAFIAFLSSLTSVSFTAVQYAIFSSLMTLTPKILGGYSGTIVTHIGYPKFFLMTTLLGIPILILIAWVAKLLKQKD